MRNGIVDEEEEMKYQYSDGGRAEAGYTGKANDCVVRAIAIATELPYKTVYDDLNELGQTERTGIRKKKKSSSRTGVYRQSYQKYLEKLGWKWTPTMQIGSGCRVHLKEDELPNGRLVVTLSRHLVAVVDGVVHDLYDPSREGTRCVYGFYQKK